ncbi:hypothetical protein KM043_006582 [Ampulex compressa]|nr:hypothetical protein KM043_006582 [Ampulex compressa]
MNPCSSIEDGLIGSNSAINKGSPSADDSIHDRFPDFRRDFNRKQGDPSRKKERTGQPPFWRSLEAGAMGTAHPRAHSSIRWADRLSRLWPSGVDKPRLTGYHGDHMD